MFTTDIVKHFVFLLLLIRAGALNTCWVRAEHTDANVDKKSRYNCSIYQPFRTPAT